MAQNGVACADVSELVRKKNRFKVQLRGQVVN